MKSIIYIVEDDAAVRDSLRIVLEMNGYDVEEFGSGDALLERADFTRVECIIMDVNLPGESGLQTLRRLRDRSVMNPVLIVTGHANESVRRESTRLNAAGCFEKPVQVRVLLDAIEAARCGGSTR